MAATKAKDRGTCRVDQCSREVRCKELCTTHYNNHLAGRALRPIGVAPLAERFWENVEVRGSTECWPWTGSLHGEGYGRIGANGRRILAHRVSWELHNGQIPDGILIDHKCRNVICVNPKHLQLADKPRNGENRDGADVDSKSGVRGVSWDRRTKSWVVYVRHHGKGYNGGRYKTIAEAESAAIAKRNELHTNNLMDRAAS